VLIAICPAETFRPSDPIADDNGGCDATNLVGCDIGA